MSCFGCSRKYGLFCKEHGCPNCGYSYCAKCLKRPVAVPRHAGKVLNVCLICYDKLSKQAVSEKVIDCEALPGTLITRAPPKSAGAAPNPQAADEIFREDPPAPDLGEVLLPITPTDPNEQAIKSGIEDSESSNKEINENLDSVISKRLQNLKTDGSAAGAGATDDDIRARLANLSGMPHQKNYDKKDILLATDQRTDQEKMKELLEQFLGETQIDKRVEKQKNNALTDIERRLRALRDLPIDDDDEDDSNRHNNEGIQKRQVVYSPDTNTPSDNEAEEDDETVLKRIMEKYLAEARLPSVATELETELENSIPAPPAGTTAADKEELPWCNICNEDAVFRCHGCDGELFCAQCFRECHDDDEEYRQHVHVKYTAPPKFKENHF